MLPGTLLRQIYAGNPPCGEMRNTKQDSVTGLDFLATEIYVPGFHNTRILRLTALRNLWNEVSLSKYTGLIALDFI